MCWHPACFVCCQCEELLVDLVYCSHTKKLFCERHYAEQIRPRCPACDEVRVIFPERFWCFPLKSFFPPMDYWMVVKCRPVLGAWSLWWADSRGISAVTQALGCLGSCPEYPPPHLLVIPYSNKQGGTEVLFQPTCKYPVVIDMEYMYISPSVKESSFLLSVIL